MTPSGAHLAAGEPRSRYPGTRPFSDSPDDYARFFGRDREAEELYLRVLSVPLLVQFGRSGLGKTSVLQAGLFPRLRKKAFLPVMIRFNVQDDSLMAAVARSFEESCRNSGYAFKPGNRSGLWEFLSTTTVWDGDLLMTPVLVFDQFEEVFTLRDAPFRAELAAEIGAVASGIPPARLGGGAATVRPEVKIVLSLREDYLGALEEFSAAIPGLFHERLRLEALDAEAAGDAIAAPARLEPAPGEEPYSSPPFEFEPAALQKVIDFLKGRSGIIEPFQLQLVCRYAEQLALRKRVPQAGGLVTLTAADFPRGALESVLKNFYRDTLSKVTLPPQRKAAERLCEEGLLGAGGHRLMLEEGQVLDEYRVSPQTLWTLCAERLLRGERRMESVFYEISHDRLAESIFETRGTKLPLKVRRAIAAAAVLFVVIVTALVLWNRSVSREREAAHKERDNAEALLTFLLGEQFLGEVRDTGRSTMLEQVQQQVARRGGAEARDPFNRALSLRNEADIRRMRGDLAHSVRLHREALDVFKALGGGRAETREMARSHERLASALVDQGLPTQALAHYKSADEAWARLTQKQGTDGLKRDDCIAYAGMLSSYAFVHHELGEAARAMAEMEKAATIAIAVLFGGDEPCAQPRGKVEAYPPATVVSILGHVALMRAFQFNFTEDLVAASALAEQARALDPASVTARRDAIVALAFRGRSQEAPQRLVDYRKTFIEAEELRRWDPANRGWQRERAGHELLVAEGIVNCHRDETGSCPSAPSLATAEAMALDALALLRSLSDGDSSNMALRADVAWALQTHAGVLFADGRDAEALRRLREAERILRASRRDDRHAENHSRLAGVLRDLAYAQGRLDQHGEAVKTQQEAVGLLAALIAAHPDNSMYYMIMIDARREEAALRRNNGDEDAAAVEESEVVRLAQAREKLHATWLEKQQQLDGLDREHYQRAAALADEERYDAALTELRASESAIRQYLRFDPTLYAWYESLRDTYDLLRHVQNRRKDVAGETAALRGLVNAAQLASWLAVEEASRKETDGALLRARDALAAHLYTTNQMEESLAMVHEVVAVAERLAEGPSPDPEYVYLLGLARCHLGEVGRAAKTPGWEEEARSCLITMRNAASRDSSYAVNLGFWHKWLGEKLTEAGRADEAAAEFEQALEAYRRAAAVSPADEEVQEAIRTLSASSRS